MSKKLFLFISLLPFLAAAQPGKEAWHWYFGNRCCVDFSSGSAVASVGIPQGFFGGGCSSVSDPITGQYLFTLGGNHVYNKNNSVMFNGYNLFNTQYNSECAVVPTPGHRNQFYLFTPDLATYTGHGITYSVVDMNQQNGLGAVTLKNKQLVPPPTTEKIAAIRHCNGIDYWIVAHLANSSNFLAFLLTSAGLDTIPVVSSVGVSNQFKHWVPNVDYFEGSGNIKASPNGKKIISAINSDSIPVLEIFDFNNANGTISNPVTINYPRIFGPFSAAFSPDNSKLYTITFNQLYVTTSDTSWLYQYDLSSGVSSNIIASQTLIYTDSRQTNANSGILYDLQLAPDGKIYMSRCGRDSLPVINFPNSPGSACNFQLDGLILPSPSNCMGTLPDYIDANYAGIQISIPDVQQCNTFTTTTLDAGAAFTNYFWSTGASTQTISINSPGKYWITVTNDQGCTRTDTVNAYVIVPQKLDTLACDTFYANVAQSGVLQYNWFDGSHLPVRNFTQSGNYYVDINYLSGCAVRDTLSLTIVPSPQINIGPDTTFCKGNLPMDANCNMCSYQWSTDENTPVIIATSPGTYWVKVKDANGCTASDTLIVKPQLSAMGFVMPNIVTTNNDNINDAIDFGKYQFSAFNIAIYNRWGQKVFSSEDANAIWKPTEDEGTYFYIGQYKINCGTNAKASELKGFITVVR